MKIHNVCFGTLLLLAPIVALAQSSPWTVVRFPSETPVDVGLVTVDQPNGCGKCEQAGERTGNAHITRGHTATNIVLNVSGLPAGKQHYVYLIDVDGRARKLDAIESSAKREYNKPPEEAEAFMIIISADGNLTKLPARNRIELYSAVPRDFPVVPKKKTAR